MLKNVNFARLGHFVNTCWPYVCDITKWSLGACEYLSQVPPFQISRQEIQNSSRGVDKTIFFALQAVDGITTFISLHSMGFLSKKHDFLLQKLNFLKIWVSYSKSLLRMKQA